MNAYDFDDTIFTPDSSYLFLRYCLRHYPRTVIRIVPSALLQTISFISQGRKDAKKLEESLFSFLNSVDDIDRIVSDFWTENFFRIAPWYMKQRQKDDVIISASPEFLLRPAAERLGVDLIATRMNPYTGKIAGRNCHDAEKVRRFLEKYHDVTIECFYSDSVSDTPMAKLAKHAVLVSKNGFSPWPGTD